MALIHDSGPGENAVAVLKMEHAPDLHRAVKALCFREFCVVDISSNGLRIIVDDQNCVQEIAYFKSDLFAEFILHKDVIFRIPLTAFTACLGAFGTGVDAVLKMIYIGHGEPLKILLQKDGIVVKCLIKTQNTAVILDFDFNPVEIATKLIMKPCKMKETFQDLDQSSPTVGFRISKNILIVSTEGDLGKFKMEIPFYSEQIERLECRDEIEFHYRLNLIKRMTSSLNICSKLSLRIDERGILSVQFLIERDENNHIFIEFFCVPDISILEDGNFLD